MPNKDRVKRNETARSWRERNPEKSRENARKYYIKNVEKIKVQKKISNLLEAIKYLNKSTR